MKKIIIGFLVFVIIWISVYISYFFSLYKNELTRDFSDEFITEVCTSNIGEGDKLENYVFIYIDDEKEYEIHLDLRYDSNDSTYFRGLIENCAEDSEKIFYLLDDNEYKVFYDDSHVINEEKILKEDFVYGIYELNLDFTSAKFKSRMRNISIKREDNVLISKYIFPDNYYTNLKIAYFNEEFKIENITVESKCKYNKSSNQYRISTCILGECKGQNIKIIHNYNH